MVTDNFWTLKEALELIRALQEDTRAYGYHLCLGGGVLNRGQSMKDLDLFFLPLDRKDNPPEPKRMLIWLEQMWGEGRDLSRTRNDEVIVRDSRTGNRRIEVQEIVEYPTTPSSPYLFKRKYMWSGLRIDVFIISTKEEAQHDRPPIDQGVEGPHLNAPLGSL